MNRQTQEMCNNVGVALDIMCHPFLCLPIGFAIILFISDVHGNATKNVYYPHRIIPNDGYIELKYKANNGTNETKTIVVKTSDIGNLTTSGNIDKIIEKNNNKFYFNLTDKTAKEIRIYYDTLEN